MSIRLFLSIVAVAMSAYADGPVIRTMTASEKAASIAVRDMNRVARFGAKPAATQRNMTIFTGDVVVPQVVDGGGWKTTINLVNMRNASVADRRTSMLFTTGTSSTTLILPSALSMLLEAGQRVVPEAVEPITQFTQALGVDAIDPRRPVRLVRHQSRLFQHLQMLRHRRPADRQRRRDLTHASRPGAKALEHGAARGISQSGQGRYVSHD